MSRPQVLGKFNYVCRVKGFFNVIFMAYNGSSATIVARDLPEEEAKSLIFAMNGELIETEKFISKFSEENQNDVGEVSSS